ncbi:sulfite exporter TauE/SafE family protein [Algirhabdus cladophorae]|uniref:sulfite exporter TauE/SafE family protein n=1 Tax=Algirhabdus cladophorae TaxID=3377108 RepID=UPI003B84A237
MPLPVFVISLAVALVAGCIKGMVGFAMPTVFMLALSSVLSPEIALAGLILPTLATNGMQAFRQGIGAAVASIKSFKTYLIYGGVALFVVAQTVRFITPSALYLIIGIPVTALVILQISGLRFHVTPQQRPMVERGVGVLAGGLGGISGIWGPPTVAFLTALNTEKTEQMRVQGVIYGGGAFLLFVAHLFSGVLGAQTIVYSLSLIPPAVLGMWLGSKFQDSVDQETFRKITLVVLLFAGLNLVRRGMLG